jgi:dTMP kinase
MNKGILIVFDGIDGAGKTTQANLLVDTLNNAGIDTILSKEPTNGKWGKIIRNSASNGRLPLNEELDHFIKDRIDHIKTLIKPSINSGKIVILDRYYYSTIAYQGARGANIPEIKLKLSSHAIKPDISFVLDCKVSIALDRIKDSRGDIPNEFEKEEYLKDVQKIFMELCDSEKEIVKINSHNSIGHIHNLILDKLVNGPIKSKLCSKEYGSDCGFCGMRINKDCDWYKISPKIKPILQPEN